MNPGRDQANGPGIQKWIAQMYDALVRFSTRFQVSPRTIKRPPGETILVIEHRGWRYESLLTILRSMGYNVKLGQDLSELPALIIVGGSLNLDLYRDLRRRTNAPLLALVPEDDRDWMLEAFAAGVDDCQPSEISGAEIAARVRAMLRLPERRPLSDLIPG